MKINKRKFSTVCGIGIVSLLVVSALMTACATPTSVPTPTPTPTPTPETKILKIGATWGLTGPGSEQQLMSRNVEQLCADWLNEKGGITIKGQKYNIELAVEDNKMNPAGGVDAATKLIYQDKVKFIAGGIIPTVVSAIASVAEKNKVLYVSGRTAMVFPDQTYTFASNYGFAAPVPFLWDVLMEKYSSVKSVGFIAEDEPGGQAVQKLSEEIATKKYGLKVTQTLIHPFEKPEYSAEWTRMMMADIPDAVDQGLKMPSNTANCLKQGRELGYKGPVIAAIPGDPNLIIKMVGSPEMATDLIYAGFDPYMSGNPPLVTEIAKRWEAKYSTPMDADGYEAWDSLWCLVQAIEKAQSLDPTDVKNAWESMLTFETAKGTARLGGAQTFGINHMVFNPCTISQIITGKVAFTKWVDPWVP